MINSLTELRQGGSLDPKLLYILSCSLAIIKVLQTSLLKIAAIITHQGMEGGGRTIKIGIRSCDKERSFAFAD